MHYSDLELRTFLGYNILALQVTRARHERVTSLLTASARDITDNCSPRSPFRRFCSATT